MTGNSIEDIHGVTHAAGLMLDAALAYDDDLFDEAANFFDGRPTGFLLAATEMWASHLLMLRGATTQGAQVSLAADDGTPIDPGRVVHGRFIVDFLKRALAEDWNGLMDLWHGTDPDVSIAAAMQILHELRATIEEREQAANN